MGHTRRLASTVLRVANTMDQLDQTIIKPRPGKSNKPRPASPGLSAGQQAGANADQTIITPRKRPAADKAAAAQAVSADTTVITPRKKVQAKSHLALSTTSDFLRLGSGELVQAASSLLALVPQLRQITGRIDVQQLHSHVKHQIRAFEQRILSTSVTQNIREQASYVVCALVDETVLNTAWGENSFWSQSPMLSNFHHETYGGERVFDILGQALTDTKGNSDLLELLYLALSLGFMGKLRLDRQGPIKLEQHRAQIYEHLREQRNEPEPKLSTDCAPLSGFGSRLQSFVPYWIITALLVLIAFGCYSYWLNQLNQRSDATRQALASITPSLTPDPSPLENYSQASLLLDELLADEMDRAFVSVAHYTTHSAITLPAQGMFDSGNAKISSSVMPLLDKIGKALEVIPGRVVVSGHTDDQAISTAQFPSNWHLSLARASAVVKYLDSVAALDSRLIPEGRGAEQPIADNFTPEGRAQNRRVIIEIYHARPTQEQ